VKKFYQKHRDYILLNKNILISGILAFFGGAAFTQVYSQYDSNNLTNSLMTLGAEYGIYIPLFAVLFYFDNKDKYVDPITGKRIVIRIRNDIKKLAAAFSIAEVVFSFSKASTLEPYQASMIGSFGAWVIFLITINLSVKMVKLFRR
jgi:hypothetical protein